jgi:hypothetical protein
MSLHTDTLSWFRATAVLRVNMSLHRHNILIQSHSSLRVNMSLHTDTLYWFRATVIWGETCHSTQTQYPDSEPQQYEGKHVTPHRHNILWIRILCLCGVICLPSDCCGSESEYCVCVEWHVYPQTAVALNQNIVSVWSDMFTFRLLWLWIGIMCLWSDMFTLGLLWLWIRIMCLCGVTCLPSDCCGSESEYCVCVEWHVYPQTAMARVNMSLHTDTIFWFRATADQE